MRAHHVALTCLAVLATQAGADEALDAKALYEARCGGCHALDADRTGPHHAGVFGRRAGSVAGFAYSPALAGSGIVWNEVTLERWLQDPEALIPGQRMNVRVSDPAERRAIIGYLRAAR
ncbi:cytochrome c [Zoogloea oryzae]|uniref:Cytochrome c n=1 Tax=Zoogloea oryzae TaxID=310767 RepID=A0ABQ6FF55_9RHOO|nr:c-type cytochrome [Zoogloea oryzae]GLT24233.1 cytochrome c [Zoogloea oryzae]